MNKLLSPTRLKNALTKCHLDDWLQKHGSEAGYKPNMSRRKRSRSIDDTVTNIRKKKGDLFEQNVVDYLKKYYEVTCIESSNLRSAREQTYKAINQGAVIIYQGSLVSHRHKIQGTPDLIIRSDIISNIFTNYEYPYSYFGINHEYHYVIADIKFSKLNLGANGMEIINDNWTRYYKTQTWIYNMMLGDIVGCRSGIGLIIGSGTTFTKDGCTKTFNSWIDRPGIIDYFDKDSFVKENLEDAIKWYHDLHDSKSVDWQIVPVPEKTQLYSDPKRGSLKWKKARKSIAREQDNISLLWNCTEENRILAKQKGIMHSKDVMSGSDIGFKKGSKEEETINTIISVNRTGIKNVVFDKDELPSRKIYVNIEMVSDMFEKTSETITEYKDYIYLIGLIDENNNYHSFELESFTSQSEFNLVSNFYDFVTSLNFVHSIHPIHLIHWNNNVQIERLYRFSDNFSGECKWFDLQSFFIKNNIVYPGQKDFEIESVVPNFNSDDYETDRLLEDIVSDQIKMIRNHVNYNKIIVCNKLYCNNLREIMLRLDNA